MQRLHALAAIADGAGSEAPRIRRPAGWRAPDDPQTLLGAFFDPGPRLVLEAGRSDGVGACSGTLDGHPVVAFATAPHPAAGLTEDGAAVVAAAYRTALGRRCPVVGLWTSGAQPDRTDVRDLHAWGRLAASMAAASGQVPQIAVLLGPGTHEQAYADVVLQVAGHGAPGGAHLQVPDHDSALTAAGRTAGLLGHPDRLELRRVGDVDLGELVPAPHRRLYDVHRLVDAVLDEPGEELSGPVADNVVTTLGRLGGRTVGVVANNPARRAGCLDTPATAKAAAFVRMCSGFGLPLVVLVDVPGFRHEHRDEPDPRPRGAAELRAAFAAARVPSVTLVTRRAYGEAGVAMNGRALGCSTVLAWPGARIAADERSSGPNDLDSAMRWGLLDEVVDPRDTRRRIARALAATA